MEVINQSCPPARPPRGVKPPPRPPNQATDQLKIETFNISSQIMPLQPSMPPPPPPLEASLLPAGPPPPIPSSPPCSKNEFRRQSSPTSILEDTYNQSPHTVNREFPSGLSNTTVHQDVQPARSRSIDEKAKFSIPNDFNRPPAIPVSSSPTQKTSRENKRMSFPVHRSPPNPPETPQSSNRPQMSWKGGDLPLRAPPPSTTRGRSSTVTVQMPNMNVDDSHYDSPQLTKK
eukprot:Pgem_evm2s10827